MSNLSDEHPITEGAMQVLTMKTLEYIFNSDEDKFTCMFENANGIDHLENLQYSRFTAVYERAQKLIERFFDG